MSTATDPDSPLRPATRGWILLARHGEPALSRKIRFNAEGYREWWARYEEGGILEGQIPPTALLDMARDADVIFASTRRRAIETAEKVVGGKPFVRDTVLIEAPLPPPPLPGFVRLNPKIWGFISRFCWWYFNNHSGEESRGQAEVRARGIADRLIVEAEAGRNVLVLAHGFFNTMIGIELKKLGWRSEGRGYRYWSTRLFKRV